MSCILFRTLLLTDSIVNKIASEYRTDAAGNPTEYRIRIDPTLLLNAMVSKTAKSIVAKMRR